MLQLLYFQPTDFNIRSYNASKYIPRPFVPGIMTHTALNPMGVNVHKKSTVH